MKPLVFLVLVVVAVTAAADISPSATTLAGNVKQHSALGKLLFGGFGGLLSFGPRCPVPRPICPINCSTDPAVVHGFCCGCSGPLEYPPPITCPAWLQCPISSQPLCSDYRFVMDCCCGAGIAFFPFF